MKTPQIPGSLAFAAARPEPRSATPEPPSGRRRPRRVRPWLRRWQNGCLAVFVLAGTRAVDAATFTVSSTADLATSASLRRAINDANASPGEDVIVFEFPSYPVTLGLGTELPPITESVVIDAAGPCASAPAPRVQLDGLGLGPNANGLVARGTASQAIGVTIRGLAIYRFGGAGIRLEFNTNSVIAGNHLGTDVGGLVALPNGIGLVLDSCREVAVGQPGLCGGNVLSGNQAAGLELDAGSGHRVVNNLIGISANGQWPLPNRTGVALNFSASCQIGSSSPGEANVISRNLNEGVMINGPYGVPMENVVEGNFIGTLAGGSGPAPNGGDGIYFFGGPTRNHVRQNVIAHNAGSGVMVLEGFDNEIVENSIYNNALLGIDLSPRFAPNPNDPCDVDEGPNRQQNYPWLTTAASFSSRIDISGSLESEPGRTYRVDFYWSPACDGIGFGEGQHYLGAIAVTNATPGQCTAGFDASFPFPVPVGAVVTATSTHPEGSTSEFSPCLPVAQGGSNTVVHAGLTHTPLAGSALELRADDTLVVAQGAGTVGSGVIASLGRAEGWKADFAEFQLSAGDTMEVGADMEPSPDEGIEEAITVLKASWNPPNLDLFVILSNSVARSFSLLSDGDAPPSDSAPVPANGQLQFRLCDAPAQVSLASASVETDATGRLVVRLRLGDAYCVQKVRSAGSQVQSVRTIQIVGEPVALPAVQHSFFKAAWLRRNWGTTVGSAANARFVVGQEWIRQMGQWTRAVDGASIVAWREPWGRAGAGPAGLAVVLNGVAGTGADPAGVSLPLDRGRYIGVALLPPDLSATDVATYAGLWLNACTNPAPQSTSDALAVRALERGYGIEFEFPISRAASGRLDFLRQGNLVSSLVVPTGVVLQVSAPPSHAARSTSRYSPMGEVGFGLGWIDPVFVRGVGGPGGPFFGSAVEGAPFDELRIVPVDPLTPLPWISRLDVRLAGVAGFQIVGEDSRPARPPRLSIERAAAGRDGVVLRYPTEPGRPYQIQRRTGLDPSAAWELWDRFVGDGSMREVADELSSTPSRFYRLGAE